MTSWVPPIYDEGMESALRDYAFVDALRRARDAAVQLSSRGMIARVLRVSGDLPESRVYVVKLLDVHPALGKVKGRRLLESLNVGSFARVADLSADQVDAILNACGESR